MVMHIEPGLFGQVHSNRDYRDYRYWGKNQFNSSFPASLVAYMSHIGLDPVYLQVDGSNTIIHGYISPKELFAIDPLSDDLFYSFETSYPPYDKYYKGRRESFDLVLLNRHTDHFYRGLEIKLTALPDSSTDSLGPDYYSCELVIRSSTMCYLACSICNCYTRLNRADRLRMLLGDIPNIKHWEIADEVLPYYVDIERALHAVACDMHLYQEPLIVQPVWKTLGRKAVLASDCLDVFVWSNLAVIHMCLQGDKPVSRIARTHRSLIWIYKMLLDYYIFGYFNYENIINDFSVWD